MLNIKSIVPILLALSPLIITGCPDKAANEHSDAEADAGSAADALPTTGLPRNPLGSACGANGDCTSGFCTDGVCCDSACGQTCYACDQPAALGHCAALTSGEDPNAATECTAPSACVLPISSAVPLCKLVDGAACQADGDCVSRHCLTFYVDADGDGYGLSDQARFCSELNAAPPAGYAAYTGDCCDLDAGANPGFDSSQFLAMPDACGSFDWNCNGVVAPQKNCPLGPVLCGQDCSFPLPVPNGVIYVPLFTEACN
jgi:hypothetical protein